MEKEELSSMKLWKPCGSKKVNIIKMMIREIFTYERPLWETKHLITMIGQQQFIEAACIMNTKEIFLLKFVWRNHRLMS